MPTQRYFDRPDLLEQQQVDMLLPAAMVEALEKLAQERQSSFGVELQEALIMHLGRNGQVIPRDANPGGHTRLEILVPDFILRRLHDLARQDGTNVEHAAASVILTSLFGK